MKITPEDMDNVRDVLKRSQTAGGGYVPYDSQRDIALALILVRIYDRGYEQGHDDSSDRTLFDAPGECPYTHAHTRHWCGYSTCRDS